MLIPDIARVDQSMADALHRRIDSRAKPLSAFGRLETLALQIGLVRGTPSPTAPKAHAVVFAGDHGLVEEGVTAYPSEVTSFIARAIAEGTAGINVCCRAVGIGVSIVDAGMLQPTGVPAIIDARVGTGTANARRRPAMTTAQRDKAFAAGLSIAAHFAAEGNDTLVLGEIGIGNSSAAALLGHAVTRIPLADLVGPGAGLPEGGLDRKRAVLAAAYARCPTLDAAEALAEFAGFEMVMLTGALLGAARDRGLVIVDGFIATTCAAAAIVLQPSVRDYCVFAHRSAEPGHRLLLDAIAAEPLLDLDLRLGEGTGAALAVPFVRAATAMLSQMAALPGGAEE